MALGFRFTAERLYELGFLNRLVEPDQLLPEAIGMAEHLLTLPPASRVNTVYMMRQMRPKVSPELAALAAALHEHGDKSDLMESRKAFAEKRKPNLQGLARPGRTATACRRWNWCDKKGKIRARPKRGALTPVAGSRAGCHGQAVAWRLLIGNQKRNRHSPACPGSPGIRVVWCEGRAGLRRALPGFNPSNLRCYTC